MIMRKILSLITVIAFSSPLTSIVSSCSEKKDPHIPLYSIQYPIKERKIKPAKVTPYIKTQLAENLLIDYSPQKRALDNALNGSKAYPLLFHVWGVTPIPATDWKKDQVASTLNQEWINMKGLVDSLIPYVSYKPVKIIFNQPSLSEMYLPILGFTKEHPRPFYIEGD